MMQQLAENHSTSTNSNYHLCVEIVTMLLTINALKINGFTYLFTLIDNTVNNPQFSISASRF